MILPLFFSAVAAAAIAWRAGMVWRGNVRPMLTLWSKLAAMLDDLVVLVVAVAGVCYSAALFSSLWQADGTVMFSLIPASASALAIGSVALAIAGITHLFRQVRGQSGPYGQTIQEEV